MLVQHTKWLQHAVDLPWRAPVASLNVLLTSTCWRNDHNGFSHQGPGMIDAVIPLAPDVVRVWLPPDSNTLLSIADHCLRSTDHVNLVVVDKQPHLQYLTLAEAHATARPGRRCGSGREQSLLRAPNRTSCSPPPGTSRPRKFSPQRSCCANTPRNWSPGWSTSST